MTDIDGERPRKWRRLPSTFGPHWFIPNLEDRDLAEFVGVSRVEYGDGKVEFQRYDLGGVVTIISDMGWWLPILDERKTAPLSQE